MLVLHGDSTCCTMGSEAWWGAAGVWSPYEAGNGGVPPRLQCVGDRKGYGPGLCQAPCGQSG